MAINSSGNPTYFPIPQSGYNQAMCVVVAAQTAWAQMVDQFAAENFAMSITPATMALVSTAMQQVNTLGSQGALLLAYSALSQVQITPAMAPYLTVARIAYLKNQMIQAIGSLP